MLQPRIVRFALYHDKPESESVFSQLKERNLPDALRALDSRSRRKGLESLDPRRSLLVAIGTEVQDGKVTKNGYGVFNLAWQFAQHPEWVDMVAEEAAQLKAAIRGAHGVPLQFLIWTGMGGSAEDKNAYNGCGLLKGSPRCYVLDSTDPQKLNAILADMQHRSGKPLQDVLKRTLVVGMAMGMTSYEPVVNLERLAAMYEACGIDPRPNFLYLTLPGSLLDRFAGPRGFRCVELQPDSANSTAGRHSSPLTRGSLYPLALAGVDLKKWTEGAQLDPSDVDAAFRLAAFLHVQGATQGRDKVTLLMPKAWLSASLWTKQDFEESLGKSEQTGIKIVIGERPKMTFYRPPKHPAQDRVFLCVQHQGDRSPVTAKATLLRRTGYPTAVLTFAKNQPLSAYMQFVHYVVFGLGYLRKMNFVTQPSVELYKAITNRLFETARRGGALPHGLESASLEWRGRVTLRWDRLKGASDPGGASAPAWYARLLFDRLNHGSLSYGELTFFGDTRYSAAGKALLRVLERAGDQLFRGGLQRPVDIYEGPAMNHSYHEMVIGHGGCFSTVLISDAATRVEVTGDDDLYHRCQFLATQMALAERGRDVVSIHLRDLSPKSLETLDSFFQEAARHLKALRRVR